MPARNVVKQYEEDSYYHVYNRGVEKRAIFLDDQDYTIFLGLLKRHLSRHKEENKRGQVYESYGGRIELLSFCLMPNHFHLLFYLNNDTTSISELMRKVSGTYTTYFNRKYERVGHLFQGVYKASKIDNDPYLLHISRYIHRNPDDYMNWPYSSLPYYISDWKADWVVPDKIYQLYEWGTYQSFLATDNDDNKAMEAELEDNILADS
jgi:putative transposase